MDRDPVVEVYRRFKHLDQMIVEGGRDEDPYHLTCAALWEAVKEHCAGEVRDV
jgi:hypothetical protein